MLSFHVKFVQTDKQTDNGKTICPRSLILGHKNNVTNSYTPVILCKTNLVSTILKQKAFEKILKTRNILKQGVFVKHLCPHLFRNVILILDLDLFR